MVDHRKEMGNNMEHFELKSYITDMIVMLSTKFFESIWNVFKKKRITKIDESISIEYWRLFGGSPTALLLRLLEEDFKTEEGQYNTLIEFNGEERLCIKTRLVKFAEKIKKSRKLRIFREPLWTQYSGNREKGVALDFLAKDSTPLNVSKWIQNNDIDEDGSIEFPNTRTNRFSIHSYEDEVGFLFISIKNISMKNLINISLKYRQAQIIHQIPKIEPPLAYSYKDFLNAFQKKGSPAKYLVSGPLEFAANGNFMLPILNSGEEALLLISVYRSDKKGFEKEYLNDVYEPNELEYILNGKKYCSTIREPYKDFSLREIVPYGWFSQ